MSGTKRKGNAAKSRCLQRVLIANRGEIALRVLRGCREMGIETVMVYSEADRDSLPVRLADAAHLIGPPPATSSYLNIDAILDAARRSGADAVHPGYGFLAENAGFAAACEKEGLIFIGPPPEAMRLLGDKIEARRTMEKQGVPIIPGLTDRSDDAAIRAFGERAGYPIILKAAAGGGGKGMRIVRHEAGLESALRGARSEARASFGDDGVYAEKYLEKVRHIEFQVLADAYGNALYLGERECSLQRRHQKLIEEAPSVAVSPRLRRTMGELALQVVKASGYRNAGTVEFLVDGKENPYFMEVNARLQVEHPVTEAVTGCDLVRAQLEVARGDRLTLRQDCLNPRGWSIECRIVAEDPANRFQPSPGRIESVRFPYGPGVRVDTAIQPGDEVSLHYDPLVAKLITWGRDRDHAIVRMQRALDEFQIVGIRTSIPFHREMLASDDFRRGAIDIGYVDRELPRIAAILETIGPNAETAAILAAVAAADEEAKAAATEARAGVSPWVLSGRRAMMAARHPRLTVI